MNTAINGTTITFNIPGEPELVFDATTVTEKNRLFVEMRGWAQQFNDACILPPGSTPEMQHDAIVELIARYK